MLGANSWIDSPCNLQTRIEALVGKKEVVVSCIIQSEYNVDDTNGRKSRPKICSHDGRVFANVPQEMIRPQLTEWVHC
jgi:hypothetical protein